MLAIKLARRGKKNQPFFRLIIQEKTKSPFADFLEDLGYWNPRHKKGEFKKERILYWLSKGAQMTATVNNLLINQNIIKGEKRNVVKRHRQKTEVKEEKKTTQKEEATENKKGDEQKA